MKPYVFDLELSARGLRLNRFLHDFTIPEKRELFKDDPEKAMADLTGEEKNMIRKLDWRAMMDYGASFFCLEKLECAKGVSNPHMVADFPRATLDLILMTRLVPGS